MKELAQLSKPDNWNDEMTGKWEYEEAGIHSEIDDPKYNEASAAEAADAATEKADAAEADAAEAESAAAEMAAVEKLKLVRQQKEAEDTVAIMKAEVAAIQRAEESVIKTTEEKLQEQLPVEILCAEIEEAQKLAKVDEKKKMKNE